MQQPGKIEMVDLFGQYSRIKPQIDAAIQEVIDTSSFIKGKQVTTFEANLASWLGTKQVISCANGTDALQIALMALELKPGDEIIVPAFTYAATAEVIALLGLIPVMADVNPTDFNLNIGSLEASITPRTRAIIPVHLFGQSSDMEPIMALAKKYNLFVIEDNAQSLGAEYTFSDNNTKKTGTIGHIGCTSFFPTKNLGCFGDGGAIYTDDGELAVKIRMIANHGQKVKYYHQVVGCNSRLDTLQAALLDVKLKYLEEHLAARRSAAEYYFRVLKEATMFHLPTQNKQALHTFNQFTIQVNYNERNRLQSWLKEKGVPTMIYYPLPLYKQEAFSGYVHKEFSLPNTEKLCASVLSLPIHTEMKQDTLAYITDSLLEFR